MGSAGRSDAARLGVVLVLVGLLASAFGMTAMAQATPESTATGTVAPTVAPTTAPEPTVAPTTAVEPTAEPTAGPPTAARNDADAPAAIMAADAEPEVTGAITKTVSTTTPTIGQPVHFTITVSGTATSGAHLSLTDQYNDDNIMTVIGQWTPDAYTVVASENVAITHYEYFLYGPTHYFETFFDVQQDGAYSITFQVTMVIKLGIAPGTVATSTANLYHGGGIDENSLSLTITPVSQVQGMIATSASTTTPLPGQMVTFTIDIWGIGDPGTAVYFHDLFPRPALVIGEDPPIAAVNQVRAQNAQVDGGLGLTILPNAWYLTGKLAIQDEYSITFEVTMQVATDVETGAVIAIYGEMQDANREPMYDNTLNLTVAAPAPDRDGDLVSDEEDNCVDVHNPGQGDGDGDGAGDACDAAVTLTKSGRYVAPSAGAPDGAVAWTLTVTNSGAYLLSNIFFIEHDADNLDCDPDTAGNQPEIPLLEPGGAVACTATSTLGPDDRGGTRSNVAVVEAYSETLDETVVDTASAEVAIPPIGDPTVVPTTPVDLDPAPSPSVAVTTTPASTATAPAVVTRLPSTGAGPGAGVGWGLVLAMAALALLALALRGTGPRRRA